MAHVVEILDPLVRAAADQNEIRALAGGDAAVILAAQDAGADAGRGGQRFGRREAEAGEEAHLAHRGRALIDAADAGIGADADAYAAGLETAEILLEDLPATDLDRRGRFDGRCDARFLAGAFLWTQAQPFRLREAAILLRFVDDHRRHIGGAVRLHQADELVVDQGVADAVAERVDARSGGDLGALQRNRVGEDGNVLGMGALHDRLERRQVHAVEIGRAAVAPAVGEHLDGVRTVGEGTSHRDLGRARCRRLHGEEVAPAIFGAVAAGHPHADGQAEVRRLDLARARHLADRLQHLAGDREIGDGGDPVGEVARIGLAEIVGRREAGRAQMGVEIVQAGDERHAARVDDAAAADGAHLRPDRDDAVAADQDVAGTRGRAGAVEDMGAADQDRRFRRGAERQRRQQDRGDLHPVHWSVFFLINVSSRNCSVARRLSSQFSWRRKVWRSFGKTSSR